MKIFYKIVGTIAWTAYVVMFSIPSVGSIHSIAPLMAYAMATFFFSMWAIILPIIWKA